MIIGLILLGYLLGSIPFSYLIPRLVAGVDIRTVGTGNVGGHNVMRQVGRSPGAVATALDISKGVAAVLVARGLGAPGLVATMAGGAAVVGHNHPLGLGFRGGRGLATSLGVIIALMPGEALVMLGVLGVLYLLITHNIAFSALISFLLLFGLTWALGRPPALVIAPLLLLAIMSTRQLPEVWTMWTEAEDKRGLILNKWIFDRDAKL